LRRKPPAPVGLTGQAGRRTRGSRHGRAHARSSVPMIKRVRACTPRDPEQRMAETITLEVRTFQVTPPAHADKSPCLCDDCWDEYLAWCERELGHRRP
jgi:hypothetical protein